jgi:hypothetical protein
MAKILKEVKPESEKKDVVTMRKKSVTVYRSVKEIDNALKDGWEIVT